MDLEQVLLECSFMFELMVAVFAQNGFHTAFVFEVSGTIIFPLVHLFTFATFVRVLFRVTGFRGLDELCIIAKE